VTAPVELERVGCPLGCRSGDDLVVTGRDRLHDLPGEFRVVRCRGCGLMRTDPRPTLATIGFYYPADYGPYLTTRVDLAAPPPKAAETAGPIRRAVRRLLHPIAMELPPAKLGRMLEIGCGSGAFMHAMARNGWQVEGLEPSAEAGAAAQALGYPVQIGQLETASEPSAPYDLIVGWMVLEHLHEPIAALEKLGRWSSSGAWLVASVPDAGGWELKLFGDAWYALHLPGHLFHYTPRTIGAVLARAGWRLERVFWHDNPNNLLLSARYRCLERGWRGPAKLLQDMADTKRFPRARLVLGKLLGRLRSSGRMTIWARRA
jgi:SAM-dependent methyltransferase